MKIKHIKIALVTWLVTHAALTAAAPGALSQVPLYTQSAVPPNVFFLLDDSSSMAWEVMSQDIDKEGRFTNFGLNAGETITDAPGCQFGGTWGASFFPPYIFFTDAYLYLLELENTPRCRTVAEEEWRMRHHEFNRLYYDPQQTYEPWAGYPGTTLNGSGELEAIIDPTAPSSATNRLNLERESGILVRTTTPVSRTYYSGSAWQTFCNNQGISLTTCRGWRYYYNDANGNRQMQWVHQLSPAQKINFGNWFTYHRSRERVAKFALSQAIRQAHGMHLGYGTINAITDPTPSNGVVDIHPNAGLLTPIGSNNRNQILNNIFNTQSLGNTPLRGAFHAVGHYYDTGVFFDRGNVGDPILDAANGGSCQSNNTIVITDGFYTDGYEDTVDNTNHKYDAVYQNLSLTNVGNADAGHGVPYADSNAHTMADVAMHYYETDLSAAPDLTPPLPASDPAANQHMHTYGIAFGIAGNVDPATIGSLTQNPWTQNPLTSTDKRAKIDDLLHATVNGRGKYLSAQRPEELTSALADFIAGINTSFGSANAAAVSSFRLNTGSRAFFSSFNTEDWSGTLKAHTLNTDGSIGTVQWNSDAEFPLNATRTIITNTGAQGVPFQWANLSAAQQASLGGENILNFLRGQEVAGLRNRAVPLGDIVNSSPVYVGPRPSLYIPDQAPFGSESNRYSHFWAEYSGNNARTSVVYVGANDGMLHGFNATSGREVLAYVPGQLFDDNSDALHTLASPSYSHRYFVDLTPTVADAYFAPGNSGLTGSEDWRTVLVGGFGAGGRGLFALDVTNPSSFSEGNASSIFLWEFPFGDQPNGDASLDSYIGYSLSEPVIALMPTGSATVGRWAAIVGNGYNSVHGTAQLLIIYLDADPTDGWQAGTDYVVIDTGAGDSTDANRNGLSSPTAVDSNRDGFIDRIYAGDLHGNLWAFSTVGASNNWGVAYAGQPLFTTLGQSQPITVAPTVIAHPTQATPGNTPNVMIYFGTGQYLTTADMTTTNTQAFYGVWDRGVINDSGAALTRSNLTQQTIIREQTENKHSIEARLTDATVTVPYGDSTSATRFGWYVDLTHANSGATGERVITRATILNGVLFFITYIPPPSNTCGAKGTGWLMMLRAENGGPPENTMISVDSNREVNDADKVNFVDGDVANDVVESGIKIGDILGISFTEGSIVKNNQEEIPFDGAALNALGKRISWRELRTE